MIHIDDEMKQWIASRWHEPLSVQLDDHCPIPENFISVCDGMISMLKLLQEKFERIKDSIQGGEVSSAEWENGFYGQKPLIYAEICFRKFLQHVLLGEMETKSFFRAMRSKLGYSDESGCRVGAGEIGTCVSKFSAGGKCDAA